MFIVFTRFGTLFRVVFSSLWSKTRLLFNFSRSRGIEPDGISHPPPGSAQGCTSDFPRGYTPNLVAISTLATASLPTGMAVTSAKYPFSCPVKAVDPPHLAHSLMPGVSNKQDRDIAFHNPEAPIDVRRPLGSITNTYGQASGGDHVPHRSRTPTFKRVTAYPDLRSGSQLSASGCSPAINATPGSLAWHSDKAKLWTRPVRGIPASRRNPPPAASRFHFPRPRHRSQHPNPRFDAHPHPPTSGILDEPSKSACRAR
ncbi:hypothetical protein FB451DRAFT_1398492 [Mycena latifolia]|nr:hypothetical protein FB451DRAFT_1398492 [Mycena latifolia]